MVPQKVLELLVPQSTDPLTLKADLADGFRSFLDLGSQVQAGGGDDLAV